jgi:hypothetical protein
MVDHILLTIEETGNWHLTPSFDYMFGENITMPAQREKPSPVFDRV